MQTIKQKLAKLIDVKSLVTLVLTAVFGVQTVRGYISSEQFLNVFTVIIAFYFGVQYQKSNKEN
jgi:thioredoxin-related protein